MQILVVVLLVQFSTKVVISVLTNAAVVLYFDEFE